MTTCYSRLASPLGELLLIGDDEALCGLYMDAQRGLPPLPPGCRRNDRALAAARRQLSAYFAGELQRFELALAPRGSPFQQRVWHELLAIPYGETRSYGELARRLGDPGAARAVGLANARNPIGVVVPCHRVIGANGSLTGYAGGLWRKKWLLEHERVSGGHATAAFQPDIFAGSAPA